MNRPYMTTDYKTLDWLEGAQIDILRGANVLCQYRTPERAEIIKDYERTLLIEMTFIKSEWGKKYNMPRKIQTQIPKASMAVGDIVLKVKSNGMYLTGEEITSFNPNVESFKVNELLWE